MNYNKVLKLIGMEILKLRTDLGLSQKGYSEILGITQQQLSKYERGLVFNLDFIIKVCLYSNITILNFFERIESNGNFDCKKIQEPRHTI